MCFIKPDSIGILLYDPQEIDRVVFFCIFNKSGTNTLTLKEIVDIQFNNFVFFYTDQSLNKSIIVNKNVIKYCWLCIFFCDRKDLEFPE